MTVLVEACVDTLRGAVAAERAGARRLELCAALSDGGTTPSLGLVQAVCKRVQVPVTVLVRVRGGDFVYDRDELDVMRRDATSAVGAGAAGVVVGALTAHGEVDTDATLSLVDAAGDCNVTFHRAIDFTPDPVVAAQTIAQLGVATILSSGGAQTALEGAPTLARIMAAVGDQIEIMAGGGVTEANAGRVVQATGVRAIHVRCSELHMAATGGGEAREPRVRLRKPLPADERAWEDSSEDRIRRVVIAARGAKP